MLIVGIVKVNSFKDCNPNKYCERPEKLISVLSCAVQDYPNQLTVSKERKKISYQK